jgi:hypothetical protein
MGSVDASRSSASNPGWRFEIGRLVVEYCLLYGLGWVWLGWVTLRVLTCAIDASRFFGSNDHNGGLIEFFNRGRYQFQAGQYIYIYSSLGRHGLQYIYIAQLIM